MVKTLKNPCLPACARARGERRAASPHRCPRGSHGSGAISGGSASLRRSLWHWRGGAGDRIPWLNWWIFNGFSPGGFIMFHRNKLNAFVFYIFFNWRFQMKHALCFFGDRALFRGVLKVFVLSQGEKQLQWTGCLHRVKPPGVPGVQGEHGYMATEQRSSCRLCKCKRRSLPSDNLR